MGEFITKKVQFAKWGERTRVTPDLTDPRDCVVFTFTRAEPHDRMSTRFGGLPAWSANWSWPMCRLCDEPLAFVAQLDFRGTVFHSDVPGDILLFHYCFPCRPWNDASDESARLTWQSSPTAGKLITQRLVPDSIEDDDPGPCYGIAHNCIDYSGHDVTVRATKIGGHPIPIQHTGPLQDSNGREMRFLAAIGGLAPSDVPKSPEPTEAVGELMWEDVGCINIWIGDDPNCHELKWELQSH